MPLSRSYVHVYDHYYQTSSSLKPLGQSKPNFMDKMNDISKDTDSRQINGSSFIYYKIEEDRHEQKIEVPLVAKNSNKESKMEHG